MAPKCHCHVRFKGIRRFFHSLHLRHCRLCLLKHIWFLWTPKPFPPSWTKFYFYESFVTDLRPTHICYNNHCQSNTSRLWCLSFHVYCLVRQFAQLSISDWLNHCSKLRSHRYCSMLWLYWCDHYDCANHWQLIVYDRWSNTVYWFDLCCRCERLLWIWCCIHDVSSTRSKLPHALQRSYCL